MSGFMSSISAMRDRGTGKSLLMASLLNTPTNSGKSTRHCHFQSSGASATSTIVLATRTMIRRSLASSGRPSGDTLSLRSPEWQTGGRDNHCNLIVLALLAPMWVPPWAFCWKTL
jgi:hypothetical protein